ncbi:MAG: hypothetical protein HQL07_16860 [Nitrospirae bacterium]|nr:hypothetical protein [Magnetococcales bacterium]HAT51342.1 hypothetical protein [Alphaproteobacteria bacterium]
MSCPAPKDSPIVQRFFSRLDAAKDEANEPRPLSDFFSEAALVILGEPGMGKSTSFFQAARDEANAECLTIRRFLNKGNLDGLNNKILYLDGLDEQRAGNVNGNDVLDAIIERLEYLGQPKFRLSCRTADWFGELDKSNLSDVLSSGSVTVIRLEPLTEAQVQEIVVAQGIKGDAFLEQARQSGIEEWITNPQHLKMVLKVVSKGQAWPETRKELFERACSEFILEHNKTHRTAAPQPPAEQIILASGLLCALILRADLEGVALDQESAEEGFPDLTRFPKSDLPLPEAARTKLFRNPAPERAAYYHRTMAEYLAARFLVHQMANGLPAERVRLLLTTRNGLVPTDLRGLYAWVATLCHEPNISLFLNADPMGLVMFGDPAALSRSRKSDVLDGLAALAEENPWFRGGHWESHPLGRLADPSLQDRFEAILADWRNQPSHMLYTVLDIAHRGKSLPVSRKALLAFLGEHDAPSSIRARAVAAFVSHCPDSIADLKAVLVDLDGHAQPDDDQELRAVLLKVLYPSCLTPEELVGFLPPSMAIFFGAYYMFLAHGVMEKTPDGQLPLLMDALVQNKQRLGRDHEGGSVWQSFVGEALARALELQGEQVSVETLYSWLNLGTDEYGFTILHRDSRNHHAQIRCWLDARPGIVKELFMYWMRITPSIQLEEKANNLFGCMQLIWPSTPLWFPDWCLELATKNPDSSISVALFRIGMSRLLRQVPEPPYPVDRAFAFIKQHPRFEPHLKPFLYDQLPDGFLDNARYRSCNVSSKEDDKRKTVDNLSSRLEGIRSGSDLNALFSLGRIYHGLPTNVNSDLLPRDRIKDTTSEEIACAAEDGFVRCLTNPSLPTPQKIGQASAEDREYHIGWPVLAAMDLISENKVKAPTDSEAPYLAALAFQLAMSSSHSPPLWFTSFIEKFPDLSAKAFYEFWRPQLQAGKDHIRGLSELAREKKWSKVAQKVAIPLLNDCPSNLDGENLRCLLHAALNGSDRQTLQDLTLTVMGCPKEQVAGWPHWVALAVMFGWLDWLQIETTLAEDNDDANDFFMFVREVFIDGRQADDERLSGMSLPSALIGNLIAFFGKIYPPRKFEPGVRSVTPEMETGERIEALINRLATETSIEATAALQSLADNDDLLSWKDRLRYSLSLHRQKVADITFKSLDFSDVFKVVNGGAPATARDLHALVVDHICTIARELRDGKTDGYKAYWNTKDRHNQTTTPKVEDNSRDRLLEALQHKLAALPDIHIEPEGRYADDNRADIKVLFKGWNVPIEIKQDYHTNLWDAAENQLIAKYVGDPGTEGYGIYLVFWYGKHGKGLKKPPPGSGISLPINCQELKDALQKVIPHDYCNSVIVMVLDVSTRKPAKSP